MSSMATTAKKRATRFKKETTTKKRAGQTKKTRPATSNAKAGRFISFVQSIASNRKAMISLFAILILALGVLRFRGFFLPATINGRPLFIWNYLTELHLTSGNQVLNRLIAERLINQEAEKQGVSVQPSEIEDELSKLQEQFSQGGEFDAFLISQGLTRDQLLSQLTLNLKVEKLLSDQISVTDEEVSQYYADNKEFFSEVSEAEAEAQIRKDLENQQLQELVAPWLQQLRAEATVNVYLPGFNVP